MRITISLFLFQLSYSLYEDYYNFHNYNFRETLDCLNNDILPEGWTSMFCFSPSTAERNTLPHEPIIHIILHYDILWYMGLGIILLLIILVDFLFVILGYHIFLYYCIITCGILARYLYIRGQPSRSRLPPAAPGRGRSLSLYIYIYIIDKYDYY